MGIFNKTSKIKIPQSVHDLSHKQSGDFFPGWVYPIFCDKVIPGDKWRITSVPFLRSQPFVSPLLTNVRVSFRYFYCRNQLLWKNFDEYITNKPRGASTVGVEHVAPMVYIGNPNLMTRGGSFYDWMYDANDDSINYNRLDALPARMYNRIIAEYYANENVMKSIAIHDGDNGEDLTGDYKLMKACYKKDYFTSALPWPQRGESVALPTRVILDPNSMHNQILKARDGSVTSGPMNAFALGDEDHDAPYFTSGPQGSPDVALNIDPNGTLTTQIDIRDLRKASAVQRYLERSAVNGNRYAEYVLSNFGVHIPDRSSYRPQYLGGGEQLINFSPVEQTSASTGERTTPLGTLAGKGVLSGVCGMNHQYLFTEHGWIMCLMVIRPDATYVGGVHRHKFVTGDRLEDYANPLFQNIGMQTIRMHEIQYQRGGQTQFEDNMATFAYQERYSDYKWLPDRCHGSFIRSSMQSWVAVRDFRVGTISDQPVFNDDFVEVDKDVFDNNAAVGSELFAPFFGEIRHAIIVHRPLQYKARYGGNV